MHHHDGTRTAVQGSGKCKQVVKQIENSKRKLQNIYHLALMESLDKDCRHGIEFFCPAHITDFTADVLAFKACQCMP